jgi:hypothetical protein
MEDGNNPKRDTRFQPGQSGNPAGKKPGTRNRSTMLVEQMIGEEAEQIAGNLIRSAIEGKPWAIQACMKRAAPPARSRTVAIDLPRADTPAGILAAGARLIEATAAGEIAPDEADRLSALLDKQRLALETVALERRIASLEVQLGLGEAA